MRITSTTSTPAIAYARMEAGPASAMAWPEPTNKPAPMTPAIDIIVTCRCFRPVPRPVLLPLICLSPKNGAGTTGCGMKAARELSLLYPLPAAHASHADQEPDRAGLVGARRSLRSCGCDAALSAPAHRDAPVPSAVGRPPSKRRSVSIKRF
ncbi:hypothetical protein BVIET440_130168 [Burkholderia vietnamiensis]